CESFGIELFNQLTCSMPKCQLLIRRTAAKILPRSIRPCNLDGIDALRGTEAKMPPRIVAALIAVTRIHPTHPLLPPGYYRDPRPVGVAPAEFWINSANREPMVALASNIPECA